MSNFRIDDDFFSPVRHVTSDSDTSDDADSLSNNPDSNMTVTYTSSVKNKHVSEHNEIKCSKEANELEPSSEFNFSSKKPETSNVCTPVSKRNSSNPKRYSALTSDFNKIKLEKEKVLKDNCMKKESFTLSLKKKENQQRKSAVDCDVADSSSKQNHVRKSSSRPTSLSLSKNEVSKCSSSKNIKKEKNTGQSKNIYNLDIQKPNTKDSGKKFIDNSLHASIKKSGDSGGKSTDSNSSSSHIHGSSNTKSHTVDQLAENPKSTSNPHSPFEISVEKIVQDLISSECDKIRQSMYSQQMSFYRELNKVKEEMERHHLSTTERMLKITEELMQMNFSLKSMFVHRT